ncbi:MAG TPA: tetratricopeptide repeat protein, partial [Symbiobacteriaceae bacterium]|nr:tetratricopeptide repeat protein [Symbiobacteriaceae bacterium]
AEVGTAKFCGSCGAPVQVAAAYQQQPYPMPMPPRRRSLTWLWVTLGVVGLLFVAFVALVVLLGSDEDPVEQVASQNSTVVATGADAALKSYLEARKAGDMAAAYSALSSKSRQAYTQAEFAAFYGTNRPDSFGKIEVVKAQDPWYQVVVQDMQSGDYRFARAPYTMVKEGGKFLIALENPLLDRMDQAFAGKQYDEAFKLADQMLAINPYSYFAYYNRGWAQAEQKQYQEALTSFAEAGKYVITEDKPDLLRSVGLAYANLKQWDQAWPKLEEALSLTAANTYDKAWRLQAAADLALAYEQAGKTVQAIDLLESIYKQDPTGNWARSAAGRLERKAYKVENGMATYKLMLQGVAFALPQDWVVVTETTGGDWWFARSGKTAEGKSDFAAYFHGDYLGKTMDEAVAGLLKRYQEPIGSPARPDLAIRSKQNLTLGGKPGVRLDFSNGTVSFVVKAGEQWVDFHWFTSPEGQTAIGKWQPTVQITR